MNEGNNESRSNVDMLAFWQAAGALGLDGRLSLDQVKLLTESLMVWASYLRNGRNITWTAKELGKSRRVVRRIVRRVEGTEGDTDVLPESVWRGLLGQDYDSTRSTMFPLVLEAVEFAGQEKPSRATYAGILEPHVMEADLGSTRSTGDTEIETTDEERT